MKGGKIVYSTLFASSASFPTYLYTVNPLYNDIRNNSKIRNNVNLVCTKISGSRIFSLIFPYYSSGKHTVCIFVRIASARRGDSNKYTKRMIHKKLLKSIRYSCFRRVHIKFLCNSKFNLTAKSLVINSVVITTVLFIRGKNVSVHITAFFLSGENSLRMDGWLAFYVLFKSISVITGQ